MTLKAAVEGARDKFAVVRIDSGEEVAEQDEANNLTWERLDKQPGFVAAMSARWSGKTSAQESLGSSGRPPTTGTILR